MTFEEHHNAVEFSYHFYDTFVDFAPYIKKCENLDQLREMMYDDYKNDPLTDNEIMKRNLFNVMSDHNLIKYLKKRYGDRFSAYEYTTYNISLK